MNIKAFIFDLNGTMIDDMHYHIKAWHTILNSHGCNLTFDQVKEQCYGKNEELLDRMLPGRFSAQEKYDMSMEKERKYQQAFRPQLKLINGLSQFLQHGKENNVKMAIASAAIMFNIDFVLDGLNIRHFFDALVSADEVSTSKPDPETFLLAAKQVRAKPEECIVFEDTPKGVEAALNAGMKAIVITTQHEPHEFEAYDNILYFSKDFEEMQAVITANSSNQLT